MNVEITLTGFGKAAHLVCDNCPLYYYPNGSDEYGCKIGLWTSEEIDNGYVHSDNGLVQRGPAPVRKVRDGWYKAHVRPQECIDKHGE